MAVVVASFCHHSCSRYQYDSRLKLADCIRARTPNVDIVIFECDQKSIDKNVKLYGPSKQRNLLLPSQKQDEVELKNNELAHNNGKAHIKKVITPRGMVATS